MAEILTVLVWRATWWLVRLLWLPLVLIAFVASVVVPVVIELAKLLVSPEGLPVLLLLLAWFWRPVRRRSRRD